MPSYKNWSCTLTLHMRAKHFKHFPLHSAHYHKGYRSFLTLCLPTPLQHLNLKPVLLCVTQCHVYTHHLLPRCVPYQLLLWGIHTASDDLFFDVLDMEEETDYLDDLFFFDAKDWDCSSCHANSSSDPDYPCPTPNVSSCMSKPYAYSQITLALSHLHHHRL